MVEWRLLCGFASTLIINLMKAQVKASQNAVYWRTEELELWAHYLNRKIMLEARTYDMDGTPKTFQTYLDEAFEDTQKLTLRETLIAISHASHPKINSRSSTGLKISVLPATGQGKSEKEIILDLHKRKGGPGIENLIMMSIMEEKMKQMSGKGNSLETSRAGSEMEAPDPIIHETSKYKFTASYNPLQRVIKTNLWLEDQKTKGKTLYRNNINDSYFEKQLKEAFGSLANLFEHLRNTNNYQVLFDKGRIRIINEPQNQDQLAWLTKRVEQRHLQKGAQRKLENKRLEGSGVELSESMHLEMDKRLQERIASIKSQLQNKMSTKIQKYQDKMLVLLRRELASIENDISSRMFDISKGINQSKQAQKKVDIEILEEWKDSVGRDLIAKMAMQDKKVKNQLVNIIGEAKRQLAIIIHRMRSEFDTMIRENEDKCMASIDDLEIDLCKKMEQISQQGSVKDGNTTVNDENIEESIATARSKVDWNPIQIDTNSSQFRKFNIDFDNVIIYNSGWQWTQLFTKTIIPHGCVISLQFKIVKSAYNAIAIGISDRSNIGSQTSLSLSNSIAYWGDRQIWQGKKIKEEGTGFKSGDVVTMRVDTIRGVIYWSVGNDLRAQHSSSILRDRSLHLMAYIQMYDKWDRIEMLSYNRIE